MVYLSVDLFKYVRILRLFIIIFLIYLYNDLKILSDEFVYKIIIFLRMWIYVIFIFNI